MRNALVVQRSDAAAGPWMRFNSPSRLASNTRYFSPLRLSAPASLAIPPGGSQGFAIGGWINIMVAIFAVFLPLGIFSYNPCAKLSSNFCGSGSAPQYAQRLQKPLWLLPELRLSILQLRGLHCSFYEMILYSGTISTLFFTDCSASSIAFFISPSLISFEFKMNSR